MSADRDKYEADRCAAEVEEDRLEAELERFAPKIPPAPVSRAMMSALADLLSIEAQVYARAIDAALFRVIEALRGGRWELAYFALSDMANAMESLDRSIDKACGNVEDSIAKLDPAYSSALQSARDEVTIRRSLKTYRDAPTSALNFALALHKACPDCHEAEAIRRVIASRKER